MYQHFLSWAKRDTGKPEQDAREEDPLRSESIKGPEAEAVPEDAKNAEQPKPSDDVTSQKKNEVRAKSEQDENKDENEKLKPQAWLKQKEIKLGSSSVNASRIEPTAPTASAVGLQANVRNFAATGVASSVSAQLTGVQANVGNITLNGASGSASASAELVSVNACNVSVSGAKVEAFVGATAFGVDCFNVQVSGQRFTVGVTFGNRLSFGNLSFGGIGMTVDFTSIA